MRRVSARLNDAVERIEEPVLEPSEKCTHIMAVNFDTKEDADLGVIRCIDSREGRVHIPGFVDRSLLRFVTMDSPYDVDLGSEIEIEDATEVVSGLPEFGPHEFLGFEDPVAWRDPATGRLHLYCTIPFYDDGNEEALMYLGHAAGPDLHSLRMTEPVLGPQRPDHDGAKEPVIAPKAEAGHRYNLVESTDEVDGTNYSVVRSAIAPEPDEPWEYHDLALHPVHDGYDWCGGHLSPGPLLPRSFVDVGEDRRVGLLNGRETNRTHGGDAIQFGAFTIGLMVYDYERGSVEWISEEPLIEDPEARTITFASAFRVTDDGRGALYAHVDDSSIRVYLLDPDGLESYLP